MIYNITAATDCPVDAEGRCPLGVVNGDGSCYAIKAERQYPTTCLPYRRRQMQWWDNYFDPLAFLYSLRRTTKYFRFSESGDMRNQEDVDKLTEVCHILTKNGIKCYGYTRQHHLNLKHLAARTSANVIVTDKRIIGCSQSKVVDSATESIAKPWYLCPGADCMGACKACIRRNSKVAFRKH